MTSPNIATSPAMATWRIWLVHQVLMAQLWLISRVLPWMGLSLVLDWELPLVTSGGTGWLLLGGLLIAEGIALRAFLSWRRAVVGSPTSWRQALALSWASYALDWAGLLTVAIRAGHSQPEDGPARAVIAGGVAAWALLSIARRWRRTRICGGQWLAFATSCQDAAAALLLASHWEPDLARHVGVFEFASLLWLALLAGVLPLGSLIRRESGTSPGTSGTATDPIGPARQHPEPADAQEPS